MRLSGQASDLRRPIVRCRRAGEGGSVALRVVVRASLCTLVLLLSCSIEIASAKDTPQAAPDPYDARVAVLIGKMVDSAMEEMAFANLEKLGCPAVPAIIRQMDVRRDLPLKDISLFNRSPNAFEGKRFYRPEKVVDAIAAILNQITGEDHGSIYNGDTDAKRSATVRGWREFLRTTAAKDLCRHG